MRNRRLCLTSAIIAIAAACGSTSVFAQAVTATAVKAAYLTKFPPFVEWPVMPSASADSPFVICIVGDDPFSDMLDRVAAGQSAGTRTIAVKRMKMPDASCQVLYIAPSSDITVAQVLDATQTAPLLTITDAESDGGAHGIICFVRDKDHVRFDIDVGEARKHGLTISSKLLDLARKVSDAPEGMP